MSDINNCFFTGRLGRDPEIKSFQSGDRIANVAIAVGETWKDKQTGERKERTEWVNLVFRGGLVGVVEQCLRKGSQIAVTGKLATRKWQTQTGEDRYSTEIHVRDMKMLSSKSDGATQRSGQSGNSGFSAPVDDFSDLDDDVPF